jgi:uncharacterized protein
VTAALGATLKDGVVPPQGREPKLGRRTAWCINRCLMNLFASWLVRHARLLLLANVLLTVVLGFQARRLRIEGSLESILPAGDPGLTYYADVRTTFGSDDVGVVGILANDLFSTATLEKIDRVTRALGELPGVERVLSLTNTVDPSADVFNPPPLLPHIPPAPQELAAFKAKLASTPLFAKNLVAPDFKGAAINVFFENLSDAQYHDLDIDRKITDLMKAESGPERFFYTGAAHLKLAAVSSMRDDLYRFTPIALALTLVVLGISFRTVRGVILPILAVLLAMVWTFGVMALLGKAFNLGTFILPPLLLVIGSSYGIHVMARYDELDPTKDRREDLVRQTIESVWLPLLISAVTTAVGFGALLLNPIVAIRDLGLFAVIGIVFLFITALGFLPPALQLIGPGHGATRSRAPESRLLSRVFAVLASWSFSSRWAVLALAALVGVAAAAGIRHVRVDSDFLNYFDEGSEVRRGNEIINREIVGSNPFYLVIEGKEAGDLKKWTMLKQIKDLQTFLQSLPGITTSLSIVDYLELLEKGLSKQEGDLLLDAQGNILAAEPPKPFWQDPANLDPLLTMVSASPQTYQGVISKDFRRGNVLVRTNLSGSQAIERTLDQIRDYITQHFPAGMRVEPTGNLVLLTGTSSDIVVGQVRSLSLALAMIFAVLSLMFLSARVGFLALLPNVLPILMFFGVLGWAGIYLNLGTSLIATIALGIAVDSTIHYMARLSRELEGEVDQQAAMRRTLQAAGLPITYTSAALLLGFLTFSVSDFVPIQSFGVMAAITLATALLVNILVLPALLAATKIITLWDLVSVKLGDDPGSSIPMLAGLRPAQARIVVLMGAIRKFSPGEWIVRQGELGDSMYVIINGIADVWAGQGDDRRKVAVMRRGDVFGEMALVRQSERSADVVAADDVEVLSVDQRFLNRIQRRYPRIASKVFLNLTRILSDRLERMTNQVVSLRKAS